MASKKYKKKQKKTVKNKKVLSDGTPDMLKHQLRFTITAPMDAGCFFPAPVPGASFAFFGFALVFGGSVVLFLTMGLLCVCVCVLFFYVFASESSFQTLRVKA